MPCLLRGASSRTMRTFKTLKPRAVNTRRPEQVAFSGWPGLITVWADDDPSGIGTYSVAVRSSVTSFSGLAPVCVRL